MRTVTVILACVMFVSLVLSGCGKSDAGSTQAPESTNDKQAQQPVEKALEISYMPFIDLASQNSYATQKITELLQKKGINVKFTMKTLGTHDGVEWEKKFKLLTATGEKPADVIQLNGLYTEAVNAGLFAELNMDMLKKTMPKYVAQVDKIDAKALWAVCKDPVTGKLLSIPSFNMFGPNRHTFVYRHDWLKKLGMEAPKTIEEFEKWLKACRTQDFNGNGKNDEYGYTSEDDPNMLGFCEIFGAYGVMPGQWMVKDGKIVKAETQPEAKEALKLLRKWYSEDLLPKGILTSSKRENDFNSGLVGTLGQSKAYAPALVETGALYVNLRAKDPKAEMLAVPSPKGADGKFGTWEWGPKKYVLCFGKHLEKDAQKLESILKMFETIATDKELFEVAMLGEKGKHWDFIDKAANKGATVFLDPFKDFNKRLDEVGVREMSESAFSPVWVEEVYRDYLDQTALKYASQHTGYYDAMAGLNLPSDPKYKNDLLILTKAAYLEIIFGKKPIESFDEYVKTWNSKGGEAYTKEANEYYNKLYK